MSFSLPVNLIPRWCYCPRKVYYSELMKFKVHYPTWVQQGEDFHAKESRLWQRRNLSRLRLAEGKKYYQLAIRSEELGLHGIADMLIETEQSVYPIEFKMNAHKKRRGDVLQLVAYAMLAQEHFKKKADIAFLIGEKTKVYEILISKQKCAEVKQIVDQIHQILAKGYKPESSASLAQCGTCEYVNFCNDRL